MRCVKKKSVSPWVDVRSPLSLLVTKRCFSVRLGLNLSFYHFLVTTLTNCFLFVGFDKNFLHCWIQWSGWTFLLYSIPVNPPPLLYFCVLDRCFSINIEDEVNTPTRCTFSQEDSHQSICYISKWSPKTISVPVYFHREHEIKLSTGFRGYRFLGNMTWKEAPW